MARLFTAYVRYAQRYKSSVWKGRLICQTQIKFCQGSTLSVRLVHDLPCMFLADHAVAPGTGQRFPRCLQVPVHRVHEEDTGGHEEVLILLLPWAAG